MVLERASDLGFTAWESSDLEGPAHESESLEVNMKLKSKTRENRGASAKRRCVPAQRRLSLLELCSQGRGCRVFPRGL